MYPKTEPTNKELKKPIIIRQIKKFIMFEIIPIIINLLK